MGKARPPQPKVAPEYKAQDMSIWPMIHVNVERSLHRKIMKVAAESDRSAVAVARRWLRLGELVDARLTRAEAGAIEAIAADLKAIEEIASKPD